MPGAVPAHVIEGLLEGLRDASWTRKADALREATALLASGELDRGAEDQLGPLILQAAGDLKWEVRKAAALALAEFRHLNSDVPERTLDALLKDSNRWVSQAATRASRRLRSRTDRAKEWPLTEGAQDSTLQHIVARIRQIGLRSMTPARIYDLATEVGERYYRDLAADTAHEIKTLLTPLEGYLVELGRHLSERGTSDATADRHLATALARLQQLAVLVDDLHTYSSPNEAPFAPADLESVIQEAVARGSERARQGGPAVELQIDVPKGVVLDALEQRLIRALANIIANAYQAMPQGGSLVVRARPMGTGFVEVTVADTGHGMTAEQIEHAMERFRSTRKGEGGTGLGLPIAEHIIVQDHGGELSIESSPGEGTKVVVVLPLRREADGE
ncbi:MAG: hypothetical protein HYY06_18455 [Deltaproteobacteria bacterium]|nr:hypothetical protein [Deltaproteobacteria bacterium]